MDINTSASRQNPLELTESTNSETASLVAKNSSTTTRSLSSRLSGINYVGWHKGPTLAEIVCIPLVIILVLGMVSVPLFAHFIPQQQSPPPPVSNCSAIGNNTWGRLSEGCTADRKEYTGVCVEQLRIWQSCIDSDHTISSVFVNASNFIESEKYANEFVNTLVPQIASDCSLVAVPFICQYLFPLCGADNTSLLRPSREDCTNISEYTCRPEWLLAKELGYGYLLPNCSELPKNAASHPVKPPNNSIICADGFFLTEDRVCRASCSDWKQVSDEWTVVLVIIQVFGSSLTVLATVLLFIASCIRCKVVWTYPSIYLVLMTPGYFVIGLLSLVGMTDNGLFCSDKSVITSLANTTVFCSIEGAFFHYFSLSNLLMWFFHVCTLFYKMSFPNLSQKGKKVQLLVHIILTIIGFIIPLPAVLTVLLSDKYHYNIGYFPPHLVACVPSDLSLWFFTLILPLDILAGAGLLMLIAIGWLLHKYQKILKQNRSKIGMSFTLPEVKLLIGLLWYILFGVVILFYNGLTTDVYGQALHTYFDQYFSCQAAGNTTDTDCLNKYNEIQRLSFPLFVAVAMLFLGSVPIVNLVFVVNWRYFKNLYMILLQRHKLETDAYKEQDRSPTVISYQSISS